MWCRSGTLRRRRRTWPSWPGVVRRPRGNWRTSARPPSQPSTQCKVLILLLIVAIWSLASITISEHSVLLLVTICSLLTTHKNCSLHSINQINPSFYPTSTCDPSSMCQQWRPSTHTSDTLYLPSSPVGSQHSPIKKSSWN